MITVQHKHENASYSLKFLHLFWVIAAKPLETITRDYFFLERSLKNLLNEGSENRGLARPTLQNLV